MHRKGAALPGRIGVKTAWHVWVVGVLSLLWNAMGAMDYTMTQTGSPAYLEAFTEDQLAWFTSFPAWVVFFWALAVWASVLGSCLILLRRAWAVPVLAVSFLSMVVVTVQNFGFSNMPADMMAPASIGFSAVIFIVAALLWYYAARMKRLGVLR